MVRDVLEPDALRGARPVLRGPRGSDTSWLPDPTPEQVEYLKRACGTRRFIYNWGRAHWEAEYQAYKLEQETVPEAERMPLKHRTYQCQQCGLIIDRDLNAALNLWWFATQQLRQLLAESWPSWAVATTDDVKAPVEPM